MIAVQKNMNGVLVGVIDCDSNSHAMTTLSNDEARQVAALLLEAAGDEKAPCPGMKVINGRFVPQVLS